METCSNKETDYRVKLTSKTIVVEHIKKYKELLKTLLNSQSRLSEEAKQLFRKELLLNFETAVQENVLINDETWDEAPEEEDEANALQNLLDDNIVETAQKRRKCPKEIIPYVVRSLKSERKLLGLYKEVVKPEELQMDPVQETIMSSVSDAAPCMFKHASTVVKSIQAVQQRAEGLKQVLNSRPSAESLDVLEDVFASMPNKASKMTSRERPPIKRAVEYTELRNNYAPGLKRPAIFYSNDKSE
ncbi:kinetochore-associated protein NSL1 homolog isoform X2 [Esox lucius]|uniref:NSL1 component of MIS12 kinetochore complex n=1 Tax=Esox lucius TaxID=8010 RepID=A0A3P9AMY9_ESOLU|nr:kinetochore-associated protein NSL1 homolog isoform X2 [Esox lucius]